MDKPIKDLGVEGIIRKFLPSPDKYKITDKLIEDLAKALSPLLQTRVERKELKAIIANNTYLDVIFTRYQDGNCSKRYLCQEIAQDITQTFQPPMRKWPEELKHREDCRFLKKPPLFCDCGAKEWNECLAKCKEAERKRRE